MQILTFPAFEADVLADLSVEAEVVAVVLVVTVVVAAEPNTLSMLFRKPLGSCGGGTGIGCG